MTRGARRVMLGVGGAVALIAGLTSCGLKGGAPYGPHDPLADSADQIMFTARVRLTDAGVNRAEVHADTAYFFDDNTRIEMRGVLTVFFTDAGAKNAVLTSRQGTYNSRTGNMEARIDAYVVAVDGRTLRSPILKFDQVKNELSSDTSFHATDSTGRVLDGIGFTSDPNMINLHCFKACHGIGGEIILPENTHGAPAATPTPGAAMPAGLSPATPPPATPAPVTPPAATGPGGSPATATPSATTPSATTPSTGAPRVTPPPAAPRSLGGVAPPHPAAPATRDSARPKTFTLPQ